ncbi:unannotated protein [freshwater metagenome]
MAMLGFPFALILSDAIADNSTDWRILAVTIVVSEAIFAALFISQTTAVSNNSEFMEPTHV